MNNIIYCQYCGCDNNINSNFCKNCGAPIQKPQEILNLEKQEFIENKQENIPTYSYIPKQNTEKNKEKADVFSIIAFVLAVFGMDFLPLVIVSHILRIEAKNKGTTMTGLQTATMVLNIIGYVISALICIMLIFFVLLMINGPYY